MDETKQPGLQFGQILLWAAHFEHRKDALAIPPTTRVEVNIKVEMKAMAAADESQGVIILKVSTDEADDSLYRLSFEMVGLVAPEPGGANMTIREYLAGHAAYTIYPFLREAVANVTARGRFGPLWLKPFNFKALGEGEWTQGESEAQSAPGETKEPGVSQG